MPAAPSRSRAALAQGVLVTVLWASTFILIKLALADLPPLTCGALLYVTAGLALFVQRLTSHTSPPLRQLGWKPAQWQAVVALGIVTYALVPAALCLSLERLPAVSANFVFQAGIPLTAALLSGALLGERTSFWQWVGLVTLLAGLHLFFRAALAGHAVQGLLLAAAAGGGVGVSNLITRYLMRDGRSRALDVALVSMGIGSVVLLAIALRLESFPSLSLKSVLILAWVGLVNTAFAFTLWNHVLGTLTALEAGMLSGLHVVAVVVMAGVFLGERLEPGQAPASLLILVGIAVVHAHRDLAARLSCRNGASGRRAGGDLRVVDIIVKKRDGGELSREEIDRVVHGYLSGEVSDEQAAAWCMAVYFRSMTGAETDRLTRAMAASGAQLDLHDVAPVIGDKHSTGGVGDTTTLVMGPMVAAAGLPLAKLSGRGLHFSGGTLDKLEAIPGCSVALPVERLRRQLAEVALVVAGQTPELAPADARLYALRDVTGTVPSFPLMASSIMSKKIVLGADAIVLDVKTGSGAFLPEEERAVELALLMVGIGRSLGRRMVAVIGGMHQPLGYAVGHALEVVEAAETLQGRGPDDLREHCTTLAAELLHVAGAASDLATARARASATLRDGSAWARFRAFVEAQCGDTRALDDLRRLPQAPLAEPLLAPRAGHVAWVDARQVGLALLDLGGGRVRKGDTIDPAVGIVLTPQGKLGAQVEADTPLAWVHARTSDTLARARARLQAAYVLADAPVAPPPLIHRILR